MREGEGLRVGVELTVDIHYHRALWQLLEVFETLLWRRVTRVTTVVVAFLRIRTNVPSFGNCPVSSIPAGRLHEHGIGISLRSAGIERTAGHLVALSHILPYVERRLCKLL